MVVVIGKKEGCMILIYLYILYTQADNVCIQDTEDIQDILCDLMIIILGSY